MEETRVQILVSFGVTGRTGKVASALLLSGNIEEDSEAMEMVSEAAGDKWRVSTIEAFGRPSPKRKDAWERGERLLWFVPLGEIRDLTDGEIFRSAQ